MGVPVLSECGCLKSGWSTELYHAPTCIHCRQVHGFVDRDVISAKKGKETASVIGHLQSVHTASACLTAPMRMQQFTN
eukprot:6753804-Alexandrium_andersonii.AAC.1